MKRFRIWLLLMALVAGSSGCMDKHSVSSESARGYAAASPSNAGSAGASDGRELYDLADGEGGDAGTLESKVGAAVVGREIIYTANVRLVVDDFDTFPDRLSQLAVSAGGFLSETNVDRMQGTRRTGRWVIRLPAGNYRNFLRDLGKLGVPEAVRENAQDVTEQYVDLQARIASGRKLEEQIVKLLEKQDDKIENVLAVEKELARVRLEIEHQEGRLRFLKDQVALSTITIEAGEQQTFVPEQAKNLSERISLEWQNAVQRTRDFFEGALIEVVANSFVIVASLVGGLLAWFLVFRRIWRAILTRLKADVSAEPRS